MRGMGRSMRMFISHSMPPPVPNSPAAEKEEQPHLARHVQVHQNDVKGIWPARRLHSSTQGSTREAGVSTARGHSLSPSRAAAGASACRSNSAQQLQGLQVVLLLAA